MNHRLMRRFINFLMLCVTGTCMILTAGTLFFILGYLFIHGAGSINWAFLTQLPKPIGEPGGGMANAIVGTGKVLTIATVVGFPVGFLGGIYLAEFGAGFFPWLVRYVADLLNGVPSIVTGMFAYTLIVLKMKQFSAVAGGAALAMMMIPIILRSTEEFLRAVPGNLREAAVALGASKSRAIFTVVVPAAKRGITIALLLSIARVAGETAPLLFTSFNNRFWSHGWLQPVASLPVMIFTYAISPYPDWHRQAWAAGFLLLAAIFALNVIARVFIWRDFSEAK